MNRECGRRGRGVKKVEGGEVGKGEGIRRW